MSIIAPQRPATHETYPSSDIEKIPKSIGEMKDLMHLDLSGWNRIWRLPDSFMSLEKLVHLDFSGSYLMLGESEPLGALSHLEHLSLSECRIYGDLAMAKALCGLTELQYLDLSQSLLFEFEKPLQRATTSLGHVH